jgi:hypothetical protein
MFGNFSLSTTCCSISTGDMGPWILQSGPTFFHGSAVIACSQRSAVVGSGVRLPNGKPVPVRRRVGLELFGRIGSSDSGAFDLGGLRLGGRPYPGRSQSASGLPASMFSRSTVRVSAMPSCRLAAAPGCVRSSSAASAHSSASAASADSAW